MEAVLPGMFGKLPNGCGSGCKYETRKVIRSSKAQGTDEQKHTVNDKNSDISFFYIWNTDEVDVVLCQRHGGSVAGGIPIDFLNVIPLFWVTAGRLQKFHVKRKEVSPRVCV
jgi:hypothetical protein